MYRKACLWVGVHLSLLPAVLSVLAMSDHVWAQSSSHTRAVAPQSGVGGHDAAPIKGYRVGPRPAWVVDPPAVSAAPAPAQADKSGRRNPLVDKQVNFSLPKPQQYYRWRSQALDASTLGQVSQLQIEFNPAYQSVVFHQAAVSRDGRQTDRLRTARVELARRESRLEQAMIDGLETVIVVLSDVRVNDIVEVSYTIEGANPIFEGRISDVIGLAWNSPIDVLHVRAIAPTARRVQVRPLATSLVPERVVQGDKDVFRLVRTNVEAIQPEAGIPPWFKVYPAIQFSEYESWAAVDAWAQRLFAPKSNGRAPQTTMQLQKFRSSGLEQEALVNEVIRFVQDDIRYFSVALGESSHRPKFPEQTLIDRLGDCKDKSVLLVALLRDLGFDAKPVLVSVARNRGLSAYLPSHDQFDHAVVRLKFEGRTYFVDPTITNQGTTLASRGYPNFGRALVVGEGTGLELVPEQISKGRFEQLWDFSKPDANATLKVTVQVQGLTAEALRNAIAQGAEGKLVENVAGAYVRAIPALKKTAPAVIGDDRKANVLTFTQVFEVTDLGPYEFGRIRADFVASELLDVLPVPAEARRQMPFWLDGSRSVEGQVRFAAPTPVDMRQSAPAEISDRHFNLIRKLDTNRQTVTLAYNFERKSDEVLPADVDSYRSNVARARQATVGWVQLPLVDFSDVRAELEAAERRIRSSRGFREDKLSQILFRSEAERIVDTAALRRLDGKSALAGRIYADRAQASNLLGDFAGGLADADAALGIDGKSTMALDARGVALVGLGRLDEALVAFEALRQQGSKAEALKWMGSIELVRGRYAEAEKYLREVVDTGGGENREFALLWLYVAAEYQGGRGREAIAKYVDGVDGTRFTGSLLRYFDEKLDRQALLKAASQPSDMERLNLAEAYFFIAQKFAAQGQREEARKWFKLAAETDARPYREVTFAKLELKK